MIEIIRTNAEHPDFKMLIKLLDIYLAEKDGKDHSFYAQYNSSDSIKQVLVAYRQQRAIACGAIKEFTKDIMEIKRMYTLPNFRGLGVATLILNELEVWSSELGYKKCVLETGKKQIEAIALYKKCGYIIIPNYGQYIGINTSVCFEKVLD